MTEGDEAGRMFDAALSDAAFYANPYPLYTALRGTAIFWSRKKEAWVATTDATIRQLMSAGLLTAKRSSIQSSLGVAHFKNATDTFLKKWLMYREGERHLSLRGQGIAFLDSFSTTFIKRVVTRFARERVRGLRNRESFDLVEEYALPIAEHVIGEICGIDLGSRDAVFQVARRIVDEQQGRQTETLRLDEVALQDFKAALDKSESGRASLGQGQRSREFLESVIYSIAADGFEPISNAIVNGVLTLDRARKTGRISGWPGNVSSANMRELIRYDPAFQYLIRRVQAHSTDWPLLRRGDRIILLIASANRDRGRFRDPEVLNFHRQSLPSLAFGLGKHACIGARIAVAASQTALNVFLEGLAGFKLEDDPVPRHLSLGSRSVTRLTCTQAFPWDRFRETNGESSL